ncbi:MAG: hypothetical protein OHK93_000769 [Ramalina farinacea]|uniref:Uncharacterized protein n=1 Tax=Ramalina farinacea TaxID=258253 RepID=A0AA43TYW8_9LECA|nr:hypothetical protein [Ramalina farinacea]
MPLLHQLYHPELYHPELEYEEAQQEVDVADDPLALRSSKRRKITETPSSEGDTKRDIYVNASTESLPITTAHNMHQRSGGSSAVKDIQAMPPPATTPKRLIRKEIPSSQSPVDTPLFALSQRSAKRNSSRSPLTERSINLQTPITVAPKVPGELSSREVGDSMETEDEDQNEDEKPLLDSQLDQRIVPEKERLHPRTEPGKSDTSHVQVKTSFQREVSIDDGSVKQAGGYPSVLRSQVTTRPLEESDAVPIKPVNASSPQRHNHPSHPASSNVRMPDQISPVNEPPLESIPSSPPPQKPDIDSLAARCLPTLAVETDSQFDAGWHTYHHPRSISNPPPPLSSSTTKENNDQPSSSQLQYIPSSQPALASSPLAPPSSPPPHSSINNNYEETAPTQPLQNHHTLPPPSLPQTHHVPASQATTTASPTQPQNATPHHHNDDENDGPHILVPSSTSPIRPPTPPPGLSSPLLGWRSHERIHNDGDVGGGNAEKHEWTPDRRVRASQLLLPASFLKDSWFVGPDDIEDVGGGMGMEMEMGEGEWIEEED